MLFLVPVEIQEGVFWIVIDTVGCELRASCGTLPVYSGSEVQRMRGVENVTYLFIVGHNVLCCTVLQILVYFFNL